MKLKIMAYIGAPSSSPVNIILRIALVMFREEPTELVLSNTLQIKYVSNVGKDLDL